MSRLVKVKDGREFEFPLRVNEPSEDLPRYWISGDLRVLPGWSDEANYDARDYLLGQGVPSEKLDPESACFFADADNPVEAEELMVRLENFYRERLEQAIERGDVIA